MLGQAMRNNNQKSDIRFIRNVVAPKQPAPFKALSAANIIYQQNYYPVSSQCSLLINIIMPDESVQNLFFSYSQQTRVHELLKFIKTKIGLQNIYLKSNNILIDYFLTLQNRYVSELGLGKLLISVHIIQIHNKLTLKSIEILKCVGSGGFSKVFLGRVYGVIMAIKIIDKDFIFKTAKQSIVQNQRTILQLCEGHPFITKLYFSFQTNKYVVIGMEFCNGGELFNLLRKVKKMKQKQAKFYFIQTLMAIEHLHSKGILYRDLKPENIIIDCDGHVRLADFGLSKVINRNITYSFCGSAQYMSPEMLLKKGHSYQVDYYCLGALLYQLVTGLPPFYTQNQTQLFNGILHNELTFPSHAIISDQLKFFLYKILQKQPQNRFQNIQQIINDPWVAHDFNRQQVMSKRLLPPFPTANFNYNFDDSQFSSQQNTIMKIIKLQAQAQQDLKSRSFNDFYYQSDQIIKLKSSIQNNDRNRNFLKNKNRQKQHQFYIPTRHNSIHSHKNLIVQRNKNIDSKEYFSKIQDLSVTSSAVASPKNSVNHVRSVQNLKSFINNYSSDKKLPTKNINIYTNKPKFSPSNIVKNNNYKLTNNIYCRESQKLNSSLSRDNRSLEWSKEKYNSLDKGYNAYRKMQLNSIYGRNYQAQFREKQGNQNLNQKVKKSFKGDKLNFHYATINK